MLELNLRPFEYKIIKKEGRLLIHDEVRKKFVVLTPEEWVRQHFIHYLMSEKNVPLPMISLELRQSYYTLGKRCDIVVWNTDLKPWLLVECKAPHVELSEITLSQISCYNAAMQVPNLAITNGMSHYFFSRGDSGYEVILELERYI